MIDNKLHQCVELEIVRGQVQRRRRPVVSPAFLIGSSCECDLVLGAAQFAEVYVCLVVRPSGVTVRQVGEGPTLRVNGKQVIEARLVDGDRIAAEPFEFLVHIPTLIRGSTVNTDLIPSPRGNRWSRPRHRGDPIALRAAAKLIDDICAALEGELRAARRSA